MQIRLMIKSMLFAATIPPTGLFLIPWWLTHGALFPRMLAAAGWRQLAWLTLATALGLVGWCVRDFVIRGLGTPAPIDPPVRLVVTGLYRHTRNPMYLGALTILLSEAVLSGIPLMFAYSGFFALAFHLVVVLYEEPVLRRRFGDTYRAYHTAVPRWGWRLHGWDMDGRG